MTSSGSGTPVRPGDSAADLSTGRKLLYTAVMLGFSLAVTVAAFEAALRISKRNVAFQPDPELIRSLRPNTVHPLRVFETPENLSGRSEEIPDTPLVIGENRTNNVGLRMSRDVGPKAPGERRVLLLGDSYTEAIFCLEEKRFDNVALPLLEAGGDGPWTVVNGGIQNGAPSQYVLLLRRYLPLFEPDVVVVVTGANDLYDDMQFNRRYGFVVDDAGLPVGLENPLQLRLLKDSYLLRYAHLLLEIFAPASLDALFPPADPSLEPLDWMSLACRQSPDARSQFERFTGRYLAGLRDLAEAAGARFGVLVVHYSFSFGEEPFHPDRFPDGIRETLAERECYEARARPYSELVQAFLEREGVPYRDTLAAFEEAKAEEPARKLWHFYDHHFSPDGHRIAGRELHALVRELTGP